MDITQQKPQHLRTVEANFEHYYLQVSAALMHVIVPATNMWVTIFIVLMHVGESLLQLCRWYFLQCIMHITVSIVIMQVTVSVKAMQVTVSSNNFVFLSLAPSFHKTDHRTFNGIISGLHFTTIVNILPKLRYFEDRNYIKIS